MCSSMKKQDERKQNEGVALVLAMVFMVALGILVGMVASRIVGHSRQVAVYVDYQNAFAGVEAGVSAAKVELERKEMRNVSEEDSDGLIGFSTDQVLQWGVPPVFGHPGADPVHLASMPMVEYYAYTFEWANDGIDNNGAFGTDAIADPLEMDAYSVVSVARTGETVRAVEVIFGGANINVWQNAIFAGAGAGGGVINGNVSVHGSVHLLGDSLAPGDEAINTVLALGGSSLISNNYTASPAPDPALIARIPPPPTVQFNGESIQSLGATLRVRQGAVSMSGSSDIGYADVAGNAVKETMDGIYVNDNWLGDVDADGDPIRAFADNGTDADYDLGQKLEYPTYQDDGGLNHLDYFLEVDPDPTVGFQQPFVGDITLTAGDPSGGGNVGKNSFYWNSTTMMAGDECTGEVPGTECMPTLAEMQTMRDNGEFFIWYDSTNSHIEINGRVAIDGDLSIVSGTGQNKEFIYEGQGSILTYDSSGASAHGDVVVEASIVTPLVSPPDNAPTFPDNLMGIMAERDFTLGGNSQLQLMGAFYAQATIQVDMQSTIMGTIVGNMFNVGNQVPDIYQVPTMAPALVSSSIRMIGANPIIVLSQLSWREYGVQ